MLVRGDRRGSRPGCEAFWEAVTALASPRHGGSGIPLTRAATPPSTTCLVAVSPPVDEASQRPLLEQAEAIVRGYASAGKLSPSRSPKAKLGCGTVYLRLVRHLSPEDDGPDPGPCNSWITSVIRRATLVVCSEDLTNTSRSPSSSRRLGVALSLKGVLPVAATRPPSAHKGLLLGSRTAVPSCGTPAGTHMDRSDLRAR